MNKIYSKFLDNCKNIENYYEKLVTLTKNHNFVGSTNEWIIDNFYMVVEQRNVIKRLFKNKKNMKEMLSENENVYNVLKNIFSSHNYNLDKAMIIKEINLYQNKSNIYFSYNSISVIPTFISMILVDELNSLCKKRAQKLDDLKKVNDLISKIDNDRMNNPEIDLADYVKIENKVNDAALRYVKDNELYPLRANKLEVSLDMLKDFGYIRESEIEDSSCRGYAKVYYDTDTDSYTSTPYINCSKYTSEGYKENK